VTEQLYGELLTLPLHPELDEETVDWIAAEVSRWVATNRPERRET
jgi:dTDP-4-amino-4,6-dideoxygalactose transaminase